MRPEWTDNVIATDIGRLAFHSAKLHINHESLCTIERCSARIEAQDAGRRKPRYEMKIEILTLLGMVCGVLGHSHHHHEEEGEFDPLRAPEYVKESVEELERKWSFEVGGS
jgi:hypothetical protein